MTPDNLLFAVLSVSEVRMSRRMLCGAPDQPAQRRRFRISNLLGDLLEW